jgi:hypothetical protein
MSRGFGSLGIAVAWERIVGGFRAEHENHLHI